MRLRLLALVLLAASGAIFVLASQGAAARRDTQPASVQSMAVAASGAAVINGRPVFLQIAWRPKSADVAALIGDMGVNVVEEASPEQPVDPKSQPDFGLVSQTAASLGAYAIDTWGGGNTLATTPNLIAYSWGDELGISGSVFDPTPADLQQNDPDKLPVLGDLDPHFASDQDPLNSNVTPGTYGSIVKNLAMVSYYEYPYNRFLCFTNNGIRPNTVFVETRDEVNLIGPGKTAITDIEVNQIYPASDTQCPDPVNPARVENEIWQAVAAGAKGITLFPHRWEEIDGRWDWNTFDVDPAIEAAVKQTFQAIDAPPVSDAILTGQYVPEPVNTFSGSVVYGVWRLNGKIYVLAVNTKEKPVNAAFNLPGLRLRAVTALADGHLVSCGQVVRDTFDPLAAHWYVATTWKGKIPKKRPGSTGC